MGLGTTVTLMVMNPATGVQEPWTGNIGDGPGELPRGAVQAVQSGEWVFTPSGTQNVSGTVTALPSGTQAVSGAVTVNNPVDNVTIDGSVTIANPVTTVAVSNSSFPVTDNGGSLTVDGTVTALPSGTQAVSGTVAATQSGTWSMTPSGTQSVTGTIAMNAPTLTAFGTAMTAYRNPAVLAAPQAVKTTNGRLHQYHIGNPNSVPVFVHLYNALIANVTVGTTAPLATYMVAANSALDGFWPNSLPYSTAITVAVTTTAAGATAPSTGVLVNFGYL